MSVLTVGLLLSVADPVFAVIVTFIIISTNSDVSFLHIIKANTVCLTTGMAVQFLEITQLFVTNHIQLY